MTTINKLVAIFFVAVIITINDSYSQVLISDFHTHMGFEITDDKIEFTDYDYFKEKGMSEICYSLPVLKTKTNNLLERLKSEIAEIKILSENNQFFQIAEQEYEVDSSHDNSIKCYFSIEYFYGVFNKNVENISEFKSLGVCYISLINNEYDKLFNGDMLSIFGKEVIEKMNAENILIDVTHLDELQRIEVMKYSKSPVIYSHTNSKTLAHLNYNISENEIDVLKKNGGYVFVSLNELGLFEDRDNENGGIRRLGGNIVYFCDRLGTDKVGIGSDYQDNGKFVPKELTGGNISESLITELKRRNLALTDIKKIMNNNFTSLVKSTSQIK